MHVILVFFLEISFEFISFMHVIKNLGLKTLEVNEDWSLKCKAF